MKKHHSPDHLSAEQFQAFLEGELAVGEHAAVEEHLVSCARCAAEMDGWRLLFEGLGDLPVMAPDARFADRVLEAVALPEPLPLAARLKARLFAGSGAHPDGGRLQDFAEGALPVRQAARVRTHLDECPACAAEAAGWQTTIQALGALGHLQPAEGFGDRVMAQVRLPAPVAAKAPALEWRRSLAWAGRLVPKSRQAWAAASGVALTPVVSLGVVLWTLFTHPTLTPGALAAFARWKLSELFATAWQTASGAALESTGVFEAYSIIGSMAQSPTALAGAFLAFSAGTVGASWVLYRNLFVTNSTDAQVAHVSSS